MRNPAEVNQSLLVEQETPKVSHKKGEGAEISEREESEFPRENGDHQSNGIGVGMGSEQSASRHHYGVNDRPSKSRLVFLSFISLYVCVYSTESGYILYS